MQQYPHPCVCSRDMLCPAARVLCRSSHEESTSQELLVALVALPLLGGVLCLPSIVGAEGTSFVHLILGKVSFLVATDIPLVSRIWFDLFSIWHLIPLSVRNSHRWRQS